MKYLLLISILISSCTTSLESHKEVYKMGDSIEVAKGPYEDGIFIVVKQIDDDNKNPCKIHQYYGVVYRKGLHQLVYMCHEDLK